MSFSLRPFNILLKKGSIREKVHIYLDESGDLGFSFGEGSSEFFVITFISSEDNVALRRSVTRVKKRYIYLKRWR